MSAGPRKRKRTKSVGCPSLAGLSHKDVLDLTMDQLMEIANAGSVGRKFNETEEQLITKYKRSIKNKESARASRMRRNRERQTLDIRIDVLSKQNAAMTDLVQRLEMDKAMKGWSYSERMGYDLDTNITGERGLPLPPLPPAKIECVIPDVPARHFTEWKTDFANIQTAMQSMQKEVDRIHDENQKLRQFVAFTMRRQNLRIGDLTEMVATPTSEADMRPFYMELLFNDRFETISKSVCLLNDRITQQGNSQRKTEVLQTPHSPLCSSVEAMTSSTSEEEEGVRLMPSPQIYKLPPLPLQTEAERTIYLRALEYKDQHKASDLLSLASVFGEIHAAAGKGESLFPQMGKSLDRDAIDLFFPSQEPWDTCV